MLSRFLTSHQSERNPAPLRSRWDATPEMLELRDVSKSYSGEPAVDRVSFDVRPGEFFFLLGPSGCGKSTTLGLIAGHQKLDSGRIVLGGRRLDGLPMSKRGIGYVFQDYALFPHMTVRDNVGYGLKARRMPSASCHARVNAMLDLVGLAPLAERFPAQLSGGQRQRVAVARALAISPGLLLLDEPLSNLDAQRRASMHEELRRMHAEAACTSIMVTHDRDEAFALADRIAVMRDGRVEQVGTPNELYMRPSNEFVANFMGQANLLPVTVVGTGEARATVVSVFEGSPHEVASVAGLRQNQRAQMVVRPENLRIVKSEAPEDTRTTARVISVHYQASRQRVHLTHQGQSLVAEVGSSERLGVGDFVKVSLDGSDHFVIDSAAGDERQAIDTDDDKARINV